jgi:hypothetical protein
MRTCDCFLLLHLAAVAINLADGQRPDSKLSANQQQASGRRKDRTKSAESASKAVTAAVGVGGMGSGAAVIAAAGVGGGVGSGAEYLQLTETEWDGKSPWFTGSRK